MTHFEEMQLIHPTLSALSTKLYPQNTWMCTDLWHWLTTDRSRLFHDSNFWLLSRTQWCMSFRSCALRTQAGKSVSVIKEHQPNEMIGHVYYSPARATDSTTFYFLDYFIYWWLSGSEKDFSVSEPTYQPYPWLIISNMCLHWAF